ncbi:MAG: hemolysin family protein [Actinomycetota bacterium]|nr:hemolysin family protein [Actinomycetota bacterium]
MSTPAGLALVALLLVVNAFFVAGEFSLVTVERSRVTRRADEGDRRAKRILSGIRKLSFHLSGAQIGITVSSLILGLIASQALGPVVRPVLERLPISEDTLPAITIAIALALATSLQLVFGELVPKNLAITYPYGTARSIGVPMLVVNGLFSPIIRVLNNAANWTVRLIGVEPREELAGVRSVEELELIIRASGQGGLLTNDELSLLTRSIAFAENRTADVMVPRVQIVGLPSSATVFDMQRASLESGHSRFPVYGEDLDQILGVAHVKDSLRVPPSERASEPITNHMRPALVIPDSQPLDAVLLELRTRGSGMAVVSDEYGGTAGIVTSEDLLEELVGEIKDEYDRDIEPLPGGTGEVSGLLHRHEVEAAVGFEWPEGRYETLGGLITAELERLPEVGDAVTVEGWRLEVIVLDGFRVDRVKVTPPPAGTPR